MATVGEQLASNVARTGGVQAQVAMGDQRLRQAEAQQRQAMQQAELGQAMQLAQMRDALAREQMAMQNAQFGQSLGLDQQRLGMQQTQFDAMQALREQEAMREQQLFDEEQARLEAMGGVYGSMEDAEDGFAASPMGQSLINAYKSGSINDRQLAQSWPSEFERWQSQQAEASGGSMPAALQIADRLSAIQAERQQLLDMGVPITDPQIRALDMQETNILSSQKILDRGQMIQGGAIGVREGALEAGVQQAGASEGLVVGEDMQVEQDVLGGALAERAGAIETARNDAEIASLMPRAAQEYAAENFKDFKTAYDNRQTFEQNMKRLYDLADQATFTNVGQLRDYIFNQFGVSTKEGVSRAELETIIDVQVLGQLKATLGAQFTENEGKWMRNMMMNFELNPEAKRAQLQAFFDVKTRQMETFARAANQEIDENAITRNLEDVQSIYTNLGIGKVGGKEWKSPAGAIPTIGTIQQGYRFIGGDPSDPNSWELQ